MSDIPESSHDIPEASSDSAEQGADKAGLADAGSRIQELEAQVKDLKDKEQKYLYLYADFENFKKRAAKERQDAIKFGWEGVAAELLEVSDNLARALGHIPPGTDKNLATGLQMILGQFKGALSKQGVLQLETVSKDFDPHLHEAIAQEASDLPSGKIIREELPGYTLHGRLLRPARVVVSTGELPVV